MLLTDPRHTYPQPAHAEGTPAGGQGPGWSGSRKASQRKWHLSRDLGVRGLSQAEGTAHAKAGEWAPHSHGALEGLLGQLCARHLPVCLTCSGLATCQQSRGPRRLWLHIFPDSSLIASGRLVGLSDPCTGTRPGLAARRPMVKSQPCTNELHGCGQSPGPPWASVSPSARWETNSWPVSPKEQEGMMV